MNNIFKNAHFGKVYMTRSGRKALYIYQVDNNHLLYVEGETYPDSYPSNGLLLERDSKFDIISEWKDEIDEEELDILVNKYLQSKVLWRVDESEQFFINLIGAAYKAGYRAALK